MKQDTDLWKKTTQTCDKVTNLKKRHKLVRNNYITEQKLVNLNNQISKVITKSEYLDQDAGDSLQPNHYHCIEIHHSAIQFDISYMKLVIEFADVDGLEHLWPECNSQICLDSLGCGFAEVHVYWWIPLNSFCVN